MKKFLKMGTLNKILIVIAGALLVFTITMIVIFCKYQSVPDTLIVSFFGACTGECGLSAIIRIMKNKALGSSDKDGEMDRDV